MIISNPSPSGSSGIPQIVADGITYTVPTNTQVSYSQQITTEVGGIILTEGTGSLTWLD